MKILGIYFSSEYRAGKLEKNWTGPIEKNESNYEAVGKMQFVNSWENMYYQITINPIVGACNAISYNS